MSSDHIQDQFEAFHRDNPQVYRTLVKLVEERLDEGHTRLGIGALWERMRWELATPSSAADGFRLNNNFRSRYVRKLVEDHPGWPVGLFELRRLTAVA